MATGTFPSLDENNRIREKHLPIHLGEANLNNHLAEQAEDPASPLGTALSATILDKIKTDSVPRWKATTAYLAGDAVLNPSGDIVTAKVNFTSGASYVAANWNHSTTFNKTELPTALLAAGVAYPFDAVKGVYNCKAANTRALGYGVARARGNKGLFKIALTGDSTTAQYRMNYSTDYLGGILAGNGYTIAGEIVAGNKGGPWVDLDPRITTTGTWLAQAGNHLLESRLSGNTVTFTSTKTGTSVEIVAFGSLANWTIDGVAQTAIPSHTGSLQKIIVSGLANTTHTVVITTTSTSSFYLGYIGTYQANGVIVGNFGINSSSTYDWGLGDYYAAPQMANYWGPDVVSLNLGINDFAFGWTTAAIKSQLDTCLGKYGTATVFIETSNPTSDGEYPAINQSKYELANSRNIPLIDIGLRYGTFAQATAAGYYTYSGDTIHPTEAGQAAKAIHRAAAFGLV